MPLEKSHLQKETQIEIQIQFNADFIACTLFLKKISASLAEEKEKSARKISIFL